MSVLFWLFGPIKLNFFEAASESGGFAPDLSFFYFSARRWSTTDAGRKLTFFFHPYVFEESKAVLRSESIGLSEPLKRGNWSYDDV